LSREPLRQSRASPTPMVRGSRVSVRDRALTPDPLGIVSVPD